MSVVVHDSFLLTQWRRADSWIRHLGVTAMLDTNIPYTAALLNLFAQWIIIKLNLSLFIFTYKKHNLTFVSSMISDRIWEHNISLVCISSNFWIFQKIQHEYFIWYFEIFVKNRIGGKDEKFNYMGNGTLRLRGGGGDDAEEICIKPYEYPLPITKDRLKTMYCF